MFLSRCTGLQCETPTNCTLPQVAVTTKRNASNTCRDFGKTESTGKRVFCDLVVSHLLEKRFTGRLYIDTAKVTELANDKFMSRSRTT